MSNETETTLRLERLIPLRPELLFQLWAEPAQLVKWWAPEGYEPTVRILDSRPGGCWHITMRRADGGERNLPRCRSAAPSFLYLGLGRRTRRSRPRNRGNGELRTDTGRDAPCAASATLREYSCARQS
jgi:hypothetical protein